MDQDGLTEQLPFDVAAFEAALNNGEPALPIFKNALKAGRKTLSDALLAQQPIAQIIRAHAQLVDTLLIHAWSLHVDKLPSDHAASLIAVGGYGRGELHPYSDIDIMLLFARPRHADVGPFVEAFIRFLWDMGLEVGHSVRSIADCIAEARRDITVATNLMETRLLLGDATLLERMQKATGPAKLWPSRKFFAAKWAEQIERHSRFEDSAYNLEPNLKEGPGGLRDIQMIAWVTQREFGTRSLHELVAHGFLTEEEHQALMRGRDFLWEIRARIHFLAGRREDRLLFDYQRALAAQLRIEDRPGSLAVEQFMKRYYRTIKELSLLNEILLQHFQEAILGRRMARTRKINRRFQSHGDFIEITDSRVFISTPYAMLELFLLLEQQPRLKGVRAGTLRALRASLGRIDDDFRSDLACRSLFISLLREPEGITHNFRRMNAYGVLGAYLPAFGRIVGQMQHDLFHVYTVDEHTLMVLRNVRRFTVEAFRHEFPLASRIIEKLVKPERLYIAALFHDIAKGRGGDHSVLGAEEVFDFCIQHDLSEYDTRFISWLVRNHLTMSTVAQRQDIHDPEVIERFAGQMGDIEHLDNLYLLTVADIRGTAPAVWNDWKGNLLAHLYQETARLINHGFGTTADIDTHVHELKNEAEMILERIGVAPDRAHKFWAQLDSDYFLRHDARALAWHARTITSALVTDLPLAEARFERSIGATEILIYALDREGLFSVITGSLDELGLSVADARIHATDNGYVLDVFAVLDHEGKPIISRQSLNYISERLHESLIKTSVGKMRTGTRLTRRQRHFPVTATVQFSRAPNGQQTVLEVQAQDRPGLLHDIALALLACHVRLVGAKVATFGERAEDIFFITDREGQAIEDPALLERLTQEIRSRLAPHEGDA